MTTSQRRTQPTIQEGFCTVGGQHHAMAGGSTDSSAADGQGGRAAQGGIGGVAQEGPLGAEVCEEVIDEVERLRCW